MRLLNILKRDFIVPLAICLFLSAVITLFVSIYYASKFNSESFQRHIKKGKDQSISLILTLGQELIYQRFQLIFDYLITAREVLDNHHANWNDNIFSNLEIKSYLVSLLSLYREQLNENIEENRMVWFINKVTEDTIFKELKYKIPPNDTQRYVQFKYLHLVANLIPFLKGFYNNFKGKDEFTIDSIYLMNRKTEILVLYPTKDYTSYYQMYDFDILSENPRNCRNKNREVPNYFYIFCRESFANIESVYRQNPNRRMFITYPFKSVNKKVEEDKYAISLCYVFNFTNNNDIVKDDIYKKTLNDEIIICADIIIDPYMDLFNNFQSQLYGYFYILITHKKYPMYYPEMLVDPYFNDITRLEFNSTFSTYSILNVTNFNSITLPKLIKEYNPQTEIINPNISSKDEKELDNRYLYTVKMGKGENTFQKGQETFQYYIFPIFFDNYHLYSNSDDDQKVEKKREHILSIIYTVSESDFHQQYNALFPYVKFLSILYCITFVLLSSMILICINYGIFAISNNITRPIKDIKSRLQAGLLKKNNLLKGFKNKNEYTYQGISINKLISLGLIGKINTNSNLRLEQNANLNEPLNVEFDRNSNDLFGRYIFGNENLLKENLNMEDELNKEEYEEADKFLNGEEEVLNDEDESDDGDGNELPLVKNYEINNQFNLLLDLKKVIIFMRGPLVHSKESNIIKFISCDKIFNEINNKLGENICFSNVGNLENLNKRFDKSIIFLTKSLEIFKYTEFINFKDILDVVDIFFEKEEKKKIKAIDEMGTKINALNMNAINNRKTIVKEMTFKTDSIKKDNSSNINNIEFIRFMKLFYAFKMYFSNVKKIEKILNNTLHMTKSKNNFVEQNIKKSYTYIYVKSILLYFNDYFISNSIHIHKKYKTAIFVCLQRLIESKDITRKKEKILYCYTELFSYYISYLKIKLKRTINELNENNNENDLFGKKEYDKLSQLKSNKMSSNQKTFKNLINIAKNLKEYINKINIKLGGKIEGIGEGEKNKYKGFLNELKHVNKKSYNIQFNIFLIEQRYNYLFAKFSKLCGDYAMAISYYLKVIDEQRLITNGVLYIKASNKIRNIINFANNNPQFLSIQEKDENLVKYIYDKCNKALTQSQKNICKDLVVVLDKNYSNFTDNEKKYRLQIQQYNTITTIFENYISMNDRFALYTFGNDINLYNNDRENEDVYIDYIRNNSIKKLISLTYKNNTSYSFMKSIINKIHDDIINYYDNQAKIKQMYLNLNLDDPNKSSFNENSFLKEKTKSNNGHHDIYKINIKYAINSIFKVISDFNNITHDEERKKYIILISESFKNDLNNEINYNIKDLFKDINEIYKIKVERLFIIGTLLEEQNKFNLIGNELTNNGIKNEYLEFENIQEMNKLFLTVGTLPRKYEYPNERLNK